MKTVTFPTAAVFEPLLGWHRYIAIHGGRGSGKSHFCASKVIEKALLTPGQRTVCIREVQRTLKESSKRLLEDEISRHGLGSMLTPTREEIATPGGGIITFTGLQSHTAESIKSLEGYSLAWVDEAHMLSARSLELLRPTIRARGSTLMFSWNPRSPEDAIDQFFRGPTLPPGTVIAEANYHDNPWFPEELEVERQHDRANNPNRYGHIWDGLYESENPDALWKWRWISGWRTSHDRLPPLGRIVVAVDHAVSNTPGSDEHGIIAAGLGDDNRAYVLEDASIRGTPDEWATQAISLHDKLDADAIVIERNQGGDLVRNTLRAIRPVGLRIIEVVATRGKHLRAEPIAAMYGMGKVSHVGTFPELEKQMSLMTNAGYTGKGSPDRCLAAGTLVEAERGPVPVEDIAVGERVWTRNGLRRVLWAGMTAPLADVMTVQFSDGSALTGTGNHPVFVNGSCFRTMDALMYGDTLTTIQENPQWLSARLSSSMASSSSDTLTARASQHSDIFMREHGKGRAQGRFIVQCGNPSTAQYQKGCSYTTLMETSQTIPRRILSLLAILPMPRRTKRHVVTNTGIDSSSRWIMQESSPTSGMEARRASPFTRSLGEFLGKIGSQLSGFVISAVKSSILLSIPNVFNSVLVNVHTLHTEQQRGITLQRGAQYALGNTRHRTSMAGTKHAQGCVVQNCARGMPVQQPVFNLTVEGDNEYYANGILVHNCDAAVYALTELMPRLQRTPVQQPKNVLQVVHNQSWMG